jgi:zinc/manganese transport system ATP-binding protein
VIELQNISVDHGGIRALNSVSASIAAGEITALAGQNGSGKSTLLGVIAGTQAHRGSAVRGPGARIAFVVQRSAVPQTLPLTVRDVVSMGRWAHRSPWRPLTRIDREIVADSVAALGLQALERRPLHELSGGQRQRALVAQGLAQRAEILLLDEPAAALDDEARVLIDAAIAREARRGVAVVHATHDQAVIAAADRVIRLDAGELVPSGR